MHFNITNLDKCTRVKESDVYASRFRSFSRTHNSRTVAARFALRFPFLGYFLEAASSPLDLRTYIHIIESRKKRENEKWEKTNLKWMKPVSISFSGSFSASITFSRFKRFFSFEFKIFI